MRDVIVAELAEEIAWMDTDTLWELAKYLNTHYSVVANILRADLEFAEQEKDTISG
jgi:hypothetical protein